MFQIRRQATLANINLGSLSNAPSQGDMQFLIEQATKFRGRFVEISWTMPKTGQAFVLTTKVVTGGLPVWMLYRAGSGESQLVWGHNSNDLTLMHNLVLLEVDKPDDGSVGISADAANQMMTNMGSSTAKISQDAGHAPSGLPQQPTSPDVWANSPNNGAAANPGQAQPAQSQGGQPWGPSAQQPSAQPQTGLSAPYSQPQPATQSQYPGQSGGWQASNGQNAAPMQQQAGFPAQGQTSAAVAQQPHPQANPLQAPAGFPQMPAQQPAEQMANPFTPVEKSGSANAEGMFGQPKPQMLEGNLSNITFASLLKYIAQNKMTGRLAFQGSIGSAEVFFVDGASKHAASLDTKGDNAIFDLLSCQDGEFRFFTGEKTSQRTVSMDTFAILDKGANLLEQSKFLSQARLIPISYLIRKYEGITREQFIHGIQQGWPVDPDVQWKFYEHIDNQTTLSNLLRKQPMLRSEWIPVMCNFLKLDLIYLDDKPSLKGQSMLIEPIQLDEKSIQMLTNSICLEDGVFSYPAFQFFLQQEYFRYERSGGRFAVVAFSIEKRIRPSGDVVPLQPDLVAEAAFRINSTKRKLDMLAHFEGKLYALLLPETDAAGASVFCHRIIQLMEHPALYPGVDAEDLVFHFGVAAIPEDASTPGTLLAAAKIAVNRAKMTCVPVVLYETFSTQQ